MGYDHRSALHVVVGYGSAGARYTALLRGMGAERIALVRTFSGPTVRPTPPDLQAFESLESALGAEPSMAIIATPSSLHFEQALECLSAGVPVVVEKPLALTHNEVSMLIDTAESARVPLVVGYHLRYHPVTRWIADVVSRGDLGQPTVLRATWGEYLPGWHPNEDYRDSYAARADQGGAPVLSLSHVVDNAVGWLGPVEHATATNWKMGKLETSVPDGTAAVTRHTSGAVGVLEMDYVTRPPVKNVEVGFERARISWDLLTDDVRLVLADEPAPVSAPDSIAASRDDCCLLLLRQFMDHLTDGTQPDYAQDRATSEAIELVTRAAER